jgi:thymidylate synthase
MLVVTGNTASDIWIDSYNELMDNGQHRTHARGDYTDALHSVLHLKDPRQRWVTARHPAINPAFALAEVIWILRGRNDSSFLTSWNSAYS